VPSDLDWITWIDISAQVLQQFHESLKRDKRYEYGELRLNRVNLLMSIPLLQEVFSPLRDYYFPFNEYSQRPLSVRSSCPLSSSTVQSSSQHCIPASKSTLRRVECLHSIRRIQHLSDSEFHASRFGQNLHAIPPSRSVEFVVYSELDQNQRKGECSFDKDGSSCINMPWHFGSRPFDCDFKITETDV
jgi:hypothetical protein